MRRFLSVSDVWLSVVETEGGSAEGEDFDDRTPKTFTHRPGISITMEAVARSHRNSAHAQEEWATHLARARPKITLSVIHIATVRGHSTRKAARLRRPGRTH
ncbi:hypothetical protein [Streptomyces profundus]|uniref:hypothetical protein n=1 Tax=Streptomyces profundus TaxID=2867410 RepID=UPI001D162A73|nr:hypothetical protein [Streptomyces sp. MA3_2.13]UED87981.1 hypothetical protein K4G22_30420 [Streptomyces sp. MA3_2.13]